jgi:hypothetical protein
VVKEPRSHAEIRSVTAPTTCLQCTTALRPDAAWCPLCFAPVTQPFDPLTAPLEDFVNQGGGTATLTHPIPPVAEPVVEFAAPVDTSAVDFVTPDQVRESGVPSADEPDSGKANENVALTDVDVMLAMLAAEHRRADPSAQIVDHMRDKNVRLVIIIGGSVALTALGFVVLAVVGHFTH